MKKVYKKPTIAIESFALTQSIAVSCGYTDDQFQGHPTQADKPVCGWDNGWGMGEVYWNTSYPDTDCNINTSEDAGVGEVCYNEPNGAATIFAS